MVNTIYIENKVKNFERTKGIVSKFKNSRKIIIENYSEIFNKKNQNFRIQKNDPCLILAFKYDNYVLKTPPNFGIGGKKNFYFSHMYNCIYDCRYCFLQGLYSSANFVLFVNYENFLDKINCIIKKNKEENITFFSGYDCDSIAMEKITGFARYMLPKINRTNKVLFEFRTKSIQLKPFINHQPNDSVILAYSLLPEILSEKLDFKTPSIEKRVKAMTQLSNLGWKIGLRFDPLIHHKNWKKNYYDLFLKILTSVNKKNIHSISFGSLRFPKEIYNKVSKLYPEESLFSYNLTLRNNSITFDYKLEKEMIEYCSFLIKKHCKNIPIFSCSPY